jgi:prophage DNA circulation protein
MGWQDRLREGVLESPTGARAAFDFEDVRVTAEVHGTAFDFPDGDGTYIQPNGHSGRAYPLRVFFWGDDYDLAADTFFDMLLEPGVFTLEHPIYGVVDAVPLGTIARRDDLKTAANQAVFEFTLYQTTGLVFPTAQVDGVSTVRAALEEFTEAGAAAYAEALDTSAPGLLATIKSEYSALLATADAVLRPIADTLDTVQNVYETIDRSIRLGIDTLVGQPLALAFQTSRLLQAPARSLASISDRLSAYGNLARAIFSGDGANVSTQSPAKKANTFHTKDLYASNYTAASALSVVNTTFFSKTEAITAVDGLLAQMDALTVWRDNEFAALAQDGATPATIDTGAAYQQLQEAVALTAGTLIALAFTLKQERTITTDRPRTIVDLCAELYGAVDSELDFFIESNDLSGSDILEIPRGRTLVFYV